MRIEKILSTADVIEAHLLHRGVPANRIQVLQGASDGTSSDAQIVTDFHKENPSLTMSVVTSGFHTRRARLAFRKEYRYASRHLHFVSAPNPGFDAEMWWHSPQGVQLITGEVLKLAYYRAKYSPASVAILLALVAVGAAACYHCRRATRSAPSTDADRTATDLS